MEFSYNLRKNKKNSPLNSREEGLILVFSQREEWADTTGWRLDSVRRAGEPHRRAAGCRQPARRQPTPQQSATGNSLIFMDEPLARKPRQCGTLYNIDRSISDQYGTVPVLIESEYGSNLVGKSGSHILMTKSKSFQTKRHNFFCSKIVFLLGPLWKIPEL
jgi:hypothetical protein